MNDEVLLTEDSSLTPQENNKRGTLWRSIENKNEISKNIVNDFSRSVQFLTLDNKLLAAATDAIMRNIMTPEALLGEEEDKFRAEVIWRYILIYRASKAQ
jgi:hypothetical protein